jgi:putative transposase
MLFGMPGKNTIKVWLPEYYYHVYNRGWNRGAIFLDASDYEHFEYLLARTLSAKPLKDPRGRLYARLRDKVALNAYCLMPNHFHMLVYQHAEQGATKLIQSICTAYTMYFNKKYKRRGPLFENRFKAVEIHTDPQLQHITRYIHLNHRDFRVWPYSSYLDYLRPAEARKWLMPQPLLGLFDSIQQYETFVNDYEELQRERDMLKRELADAI